MAALSAIERLALSVYRYTFSFRPEYLAPRLAVFAGAGTYFGIADYIEKDHKICNGITQNVIACTVRLAYSVPMTIMFGTAPVAFTTLGVLGVMCIPIKRLDG